MATGLFDIASERLEENTEMDRLAARGTIRIAIKDAGLDVNSVTIPQLRTVFEKLMPPELDARGVRNAVAICATVMDEITRAASAAGLKAPESPDDVFKRLGGS